MRRLIIGLAIATVVLLLILVGMGVWLANRALRTVHYRPESPPPTITVPQYPEPADNGFGALARAAATLEPEENAIAAAHDLAWDSHGPEAERLVTAHAASLKDARTALDGECLQPRLSGVEATYPHLRHCRTLTRLFVLEGRLREREGRPGEAAQSYVEALRLGPVVSRNGCLIHALVGVALTELAAPELARCVGTGKLSDDALGALDDDLRQIMADSTPIHETLAVEWAWTDGTLTDLESGRIDGDAVLGAGTLVTQAMVGSAKLELQDKLGRAIEDAKKPFAEWSYEMPEPETVLGKVMLPVFARAGTKTIQRDALLSGLRVHVAVQRFRLAHGELPARHQDLVPEYLDEPALDPFDGKPLRYATSARGYTVYSVGPDGVDDGGGARLGRQTQEGDIIIWPAVSINALREAPGPDAMIPPPVDR